MNCATSCINVAVGGHDCFTNRHLVVCNLIHHLLHKHAECSQINWCREPLQQQKHKSMYFNNYITDVFSATETNLSTVIRLHISLRMSLALTTPLELILPFPIQSLVFAMKMINIVEYKELACYKQFLVFPQCILPFEILTLQ